MIRILDDPTYKLLKKALDASWLRQQAISDNIANINTPGYQAERGVFEEELKKSMSDGPASPNAVQNSSGSLRGADREVEPRLVRDKSPAMRNDKNNVDIDLEMSNMAANQLLYSALVEQANQKLNTLRYVIRGGG